MDNLAFWLSYLSVSLLALIGAIALSFYIKRFFADYAGASYGEGNKWGFISDLAIYPILIVYTLATFHLLTLS